MRRAAFATLAVLLSALLTLAAVELAVRWQDPTPRAQVVRVGRAELKIIDGTPTWRAQGSAGREAVGCARSGDGLSVTLSGSSILFGSGLEPEQSPPVALQAALPPGSCVRGLAQPGYTFDSQRLTLEAALRAERPQRAVLEIWENSPSRFVVVDQTAYNLHGLGVGADGLPVVPGLPRGLTRWLLPRSRAFEALALNAAPVAEVGIGELWRRFARERLGPALEQLRAQGVEPLLYLAPRLDRPFSEQLERPQDPYGPALQAAEDLGVRAVYGAQLLRDQPVEQVRLDPCCHLNARGVQALAEALAIELTANPPPADPGAPPRLE